MALSIHTLSPGKRTRRGAKRVGRGNGSQKGTTAGKGTKGQKARSGGRRGLARRALKKAILKVPKNRGFKSMYPKLATVTLQQLEKVCQHGDKVNPVWLHEHGFPVRPNEVVKILATGTITKQIMVQGCIATKTALAAIEKAGGVLVY